MVFSTFLCRAFTAHNEDTPRSCDIPSVSFHGAPDPCVTGQSEGLEQRFELVKDGILTPPKDIRQDGSRMMINSMPEPT
jgi:hypothetical protein